MASVRTDDIIGALGQMRDLNGRTNELLQIIQRQQQANRGAISQMQSAATLIGTLMQGRQDMQDIMTAVQGHRGDMNASVDRIREALNGQPTMDEMQTVIQALQAAQNQAQASLTVGAAASMPAAALPRGTPFTPGPGPAYGGGYRRSSDMKFNTRKHKGGYNWRSWRSTEKKTKTRTKKRNKKRLSSKRS
jgi:TolA-binding protein